MAVEDETEAGSSLPAAPDERSENTVISGHAAGRPTPGSTAEIGTALQGTMLGPYRLDSFVGGGGMGAVFRAHDTTLDRVVAVKVLSRAQSTDEEMLRRFRNEAQSAARLDHENIGRVHAVGSDDGWHYIVFEFIEGRNVRDIVREDGPFDIARTIDVAVQVADALEHASERDVVHRDIKPSNIVITPAGRARIVDMGLARLAPAAGTNDLTLSGMTLGTFDYISPEQARDPRAADVRSDLYSLGCTIFFMLAGRPPFAEGSMVQKLLQHQQDSPPAIDSLRPDVPKRLAAILGRLMEKDPDSRYQRPAVLVADLLACADENGIELASPRPATGAVPSVAPRPATAVLPWLLPVAGLAATVAALWFRSAFDRLGGDEAAMVAPAVDAPAARGDAAAGGRILRVVDSPSAENECGTLDEAIRRAVDGDAIDLAFSGQRDVRPFRLQGRRLEVRAAAGARPVVRFVAAVAGTGASGVGCEIGDGGLRLSRVSLRLLRDGATDATQTLFTICSGSLVCEDVALEMADVQLDAAEPPANAESAFVRVVAAADGAAKACAVSMVRSKVRGAAVFLDASSSGPDRVALSWSGGGAVSPRLIVAEGVRSDAGELQVECRLEQAVFACRNGLIAMRDTPLRPVPPRVRVLAEDCRFLLAESPLLEQSGIADSETYRDAITWTDRGGSYEGSDIFRRIDGSAGTVNEGFHEQQDFLRHTPRVDAWPDPEAWIEDAG
jgi:hypothetical protein